jgi:hypothetical protein
MLFFDGIRVAVEMAGHAYDRLAKSLQRAAVADIPDQEAIQLVPLCFLDAWAIIDSVNRLRVLLNRLPQFKKNAHSLQIFLRKTGVVEDLRNTVQHLDTEIDKLSANGLSVWGDLTWLVLLDATVGKFKVGLLVSGTQFGASHAMPNLAGVEMHEAVDHITLAADGKEVDLSNVMRAMTTFVEKLEEVLTPQFKQHESAPSDYLIIADMVATPACERGADDSAA